MRKQCVLNGMATSDPDETSSKSASTSASRRSSATGPWAATAGRLATRACSSWRRSRCQTRNERCSTDSNWPVSSMAACGRRDSSGSVSRWSSPSSAASRRTQGTRTSGWFHSRPSVPPGRSTRVASDRNAVASNHPKLSAASTASTDRDTAGRASARPSTACARGEDSRSCASISGTGSTAMTACPWPRISRVSLPVPAPTSITWARGRRTSHSTATLAYGGRPSSNCSARAAKARAPRGSGRGGSRSVGPSGVGAAVGSDGVRGAAGGRGGVDMARAA